MTLFLSTFAAGLGGPVRRALEKSIPVRVRTELDGALLYETAATPAAVRDLPFFNNSFQVLRTFSDLGAGRGEEVLGEMLAAILRDSGLGMPRDLKGTFRIVTSWSNRLVGVDRDLLERLERKLSTGRLKTHRGRPDHELWLSYRSEGYGFFLLRLTRHTAYEKVLQKGELRPELAWILCWLSEPQAGELMLDPFCGSGAIPLMRASRFPRGLVLASDTDEAQVERLKALVKERDLRKRLVVRQADARDLSRYETGSIHKIVTDPPWGHFAQLGADPETFYSAILRELSRILAPQGILVILLARDEIFPEILAKFSDELHVVEIYPILLSGKKASIYKLRKPAA